MPPVKTRAGIAEPLHHLVHASPHPLADLSVTLVSLDQDDVVAVGLEDPDVLLGDPLVVTVVENPDVAVVPDKHDARRRLGTVFAIAVRRRHDLLHMDPADLLLFVVLRESRRHNRQRQRHYQPDLHSRHGSVLFLFASVFALHTNRRATGPPL